ncbi:MAG TPA: GGDEF domain-containing protein [Longimicrobiaceae bacterium]|nr:GGDEF domain-containing protein [Longimicrobiaceae bacterium]
MSDEQLGSLVALIGLLAQLGGTVPLAGLFFLLRGQAGRRPYFLAWSQGWLALVAALSAVLLLYVMPGLEAGASPLGKVVVFLYQLAKLLFVAFLAAGTLGYVMGVRVRAFFARAGIPLAAYALASALFSRDLNQVVVWQSPVAALAFAGCAVLLFRLRPSRATLGSRVTAAAFATLAALWITYGVAFARSVDVAGPGPAGPPLLALVVQHNSYIDLLLQMLLGYGMVVLLMEDAKREADDAHAQLAVAHDELKRQALHDSLTGALNRRAFYERVGLEAARARFGTAVMLDMDNLKEVNDVHGHAAGDDLLRRLADTLRAATRASDRLYRWGGDEFLLLLPGARAAEVEPRVREFIRLANASPPPGEGPALPLLLSLGAADYEGAEDLEAAIRRADAEMYEEKARNRQLRPVETPTR